MTHAHTPRKNGSTPGVNQESVTSGPFRDGPSSFSPPLVDNREPFGGDEDAELAFLDSLKVATRLTDGKPWGSPRPAEWFKPRAPEHRVKTFTSRGRIA